MYFCLHVSCVGACHMYVGYTGNKLQAQWFVVFFPSDIYCWRGFFILILAEASYANDKSVSKQREHSMNPVIKPLATKCIWHLTFSVIWSFTVILGPGFCLFVPYISWLWYVLKTIFEKEFKFWNTVLFWLKVPI